MPAERSTRALKKLKRREEPASRVLCSAKTLGPRFEGEGLDRRLGHQLSLEVGGRPSLELAAVMAGARRPRRKDARPQEAHGQDQHRHQSQAPVDDKEQRGAGQHVEGRQQPPGDRGAHGLFHHPLIPGKPGQHVSYLGAGVEIQRQALQVVEQPLPQIAQHPGADQGIEIVADQAADRHHHRADPQPDQDADQHLAIPADQGVVDDVLEGEGHQRPEGQFQHQAQADQHALFPVGLQAGGHEIQKPNESHGGISFDSMRLGEEKNTGPPAHPFQAAH